MKKGNLDMDFFKKHFIAHKLTSFQTIIIGFAAVILIGASLLMLPISTADRQGAHFEDALFTATSATCVTGLVTNDTGTYWSHFGQTVILILIQIGGLGVVSITAAFALISGRKIGLMQRNVIQEAISAPQMGGIVKLTKFLITASLAVELAGSLLMMPAFCKEFGIGKGIWYSVFHSVSAFCNAGFDLMGVKEKFSSLTSFAANPLINIVIMLLITVGGIGFLTLDDIRTHKLHIKKYRMQSKVILTVSAVLVILPALYFYFFEFSSDSWGMSGSEKFLASLFQSVTLRTAGFNTVDFGGITQCGLSVMMILMLIGGSPGSTAGGMKTTTAAVLLWSAVSVFRKKNTTDFYGRRIPEDTVSHAAAILILYLALFISGGLIISRLDGLPVITCLFETASAVGTVGLTLGVTPDLCTASHIILTILMFIGRVGGLTLIYAALSSSGVNPSKLPQEKIMVG